MIRRMLLLPRLLKHRPGETGDRRPNSAGMIACMRYASREEWICEWLKSNILVCTCLLKAIWEYWMECETAD